MTNYGFAEAILFLLEITKTIKLSAQKEKERCLIDHTLFGQRSWNLQSSFNFTSKYSEFGRLLSQVKRENLTCACFGLHLSHQTSN